MKNKTVKPMVAIITFIALFIVLGLGTKTKAVDTSKFEVKIAVGFNDNYKVGYSTPVTLTIKDKYKDINGEVEIRVPSSNGKYMSYVKPISMQKSSEKEITINVPVGANRSEYTLVINNGQEKVYQDSFTIGMTSNNMTGFIGILSEDFNSLSYINQLPAPSGATLLTKVIKLDEKNFPEDIFTLDAFDVLVINDFDTSKLSKAQYIILKQWVNNGGTLVLGTGQKHTKTLGIFKDDFIQGSVNEVKTISTSIINSMGTNGDNKNSAQIDVLPLGVKDRTVLMEDKNVVLVQKLSKGNGVVGILAFDLSQTPFANWSNNSAFAQKLFEMINPNMVNLQNIKGNNIQNDYGLYGDIVNRFSEMAKANTSSFYFILFIYIFVVAPLNYFVLKKLDKRQYMWISVPAIAIIFGILVYVAGSGTRLSKITTNMVSVLNIDKRGNAFSETYAGILNSNKAKVNIVSKNGEKIIPLSDLNFNTIAGKVSGNEEMEAKIFATEGGGIEYKNSSILQNKILRIQENSVNIGKLETDISTKNGDITGTIKNATNLDFYDLYIITPSKYYVIKDFKSGKTCNLSTASVATSGGLQQMMQQIFFSYNGNVSNLSGSSRTEFIDKYQEGMMMQLITRNNGGNLAGVTLVAFSKTAIHAPLIINGIEGIKNERNMVVMPLTLSFKNGASFDYPLGYVPYEVTNTSSLQYNSVTNAFYGNGSAEVTYQLEASMSAEEIEINTTNNLIKSSGNSEYYIYNIDKNTYDTMPLGVIKGDVLKKYLSKDNQVRIKLEVKGDQSSVPQMSAKGGTK